MKKILLVFTLLLTTGILCTANAQNNQKVLGEWKYEVSQAPYGYDKGVIVLAEKDKVLSGELQFGSGSKIKLQSVSFEKDTLKLSTYVDGEYVTAVSAVKGNKMEGKVDTSQGVMPLKAEKVAKEKKK